jgi:hypothetical protein
MYSACGVGHARKYLPDSSALSRATCTLESLGWKGYHLVVDEPVDATSIRSLLLYSTVPVRYRQTNSFRGSVKGKRVKSPSVLGASGSAGDGMAA